VLRNTLQRLRSALGERQVQRLEDIPVELFLRFVDPRAGLNNRGNLLAPFGGNGGLEEGLGADVLTERSGGGDGGRFGDRDAAGFEQLRGKSAAAVDFNGENVI
jgi:hypothetical protein